MPFLFRGPRRLFLPGKTGPDYALHWLKGATHLMRFQRAFLWAFPHHGEFSFRRNGFTFDSCFTRECATAVRAEKGNTALAVSQTPHSQRQPEMPQDHKILCSFGCLPVTCRQALTCCGMDKLTVRVKCCWSQSEKQHRCCLFTRG